MKIFLKHFSTVKRIDTLKTYTELLKNRNYNSIINDFTIHPQSDPQILNLYILAMHHSGKLNSLAQQLNLLLLKKSSENSLKSDLETNQNSRDFLLQFTNQNDSSQPIQLNIKEIYSTSKILANALWSISKWIIPLTILYFVAEQQGLMKNTFSSNPDLETKKSSKPVTFKDVQGVDEAKAELEEVVMFLKEPERFMELGGKLPRGVLLYGPPGTGKTYLAKAVAGEAGVPFFQISGSEFDEMFVGLGAKRVRELFSMAKRKAPCIIFIDELDAVGSKRNAKDQSYMRQTLNQLLVELDGFSSNQGVIVIGATNTPDSLDKALVRPGRFDKLVPVPLPDVAGRTAILNIHMKGVSVDPNVKVDTIARGTPGFSGADLANLINQAAIKASKEKSKFVSTNDLEWAKDKIIMGSERKSAVISESSKKLTAYHEGGHALVSIYTTGALPLHKVTVIPRGQALGVTVQLPANDQTSITKSELLAKLDVCMGGRVAEELVFGANNVTTGASNDLEQATKIARSMVLNYGMSESFGLTSLQSSSYEHASSETRSIVEKEVKDILDAAYVRATDLLNEHRVELDRLADSLLEYETLDGSQVNQVIKGINPFALA